MRQLGTPDLTWRDLLVIVRTSGPGSEIFHAEHPGQPRPFEVAMHALDMDRNIEYSTRWLQWAKTVDGDKGRNLPEMHSFPWEPKPDGGYRADAMTFEEAMDFAGWSAEMSEHLRGGGDG